MKHLSSDFLIHEMIIEDASIIAAPLVMYLFDWWPEGTTVSQIIYKTLIPLASELVSVFELYIFLYYNTVSIASSAFSRLYNSSIISNINRSRMYYVYL